MIISRIDIFQKGHFTMKLTSAILKKIIMQEVAKFGKERSTEDAASDTDEVEADEFADTLENPHNYYKALGLEEARLIKRLNRIREAKKTILKNSRGR
jgi:hypothetical protein